MSFTSSGSSKLSKADFRSKRKHMKISPPCVRSFNSVFCSCQRQDALTVTASVLTRRNALLTTLVGAPIIVPLRARSDVLKDALRGFTRPDIRVQDALVVLLDAKSTLREIQGIAATPGDSQERFRARAFWPAYAMRLRGVAEAAPVVAGVIIGASDKEETLSEYYGGKAQGAGVADTVYQELGRVLTISGRTIRLEAQETPDAASGAERAIDGFLQKVPVSLLVDAQEFRVQRAKNAGSL